MTRIAGVVAAVGVAASVAGATAGVEQAIDFQSDALGRCPEGLLVYGEKADVVKGRWQELRVEFSGTRFRVFLDGQPLFEVEDDTFAEPGRAGLWTKADSVTAIDGLKIARVLPSADAVAPAR